MKRNRSSFGDFRCAHCQNFVSAAHFLSGVNNRNHCPYCLWSCHLDLFAAGDRLSACRGRMRPIGLTMKKGRNKYRLEAGGELMLIHECVECGSLSINRIAADDDPDSIMDIFRASHAADPRARIKCDAQGIILLGANDEAMVQRQLFGRSVEMYAIG